MNPLIGKMIEMNVKHSLIGAGGGDFFVKYRADIEITESNDIVVVIESTCPYGDPSVDDIAAAKDAIHEGCLDVLGPREVGAQVRVHDLTIHPVDFKPHEFARWTARNLYRHLEQ